MAGEEVRDSSPTKLASDVEGPLAVVFTDLGSARRHGVDVRAGAQKRRGDGRFSEFCGDVERLDAAAVGGRVDVGPVAQRQQNFDHVAVVLVLAGRVERPRVLP